MSRRIFAVDPGTRLSAWAVFEEDGKGQIGLTRSVAESLPERVSEMAGALYAVAAKYQATEIIVEMPRVYRTGKQKGDPNDLVDLAFAAGGIAVILSAIEGLTHVVIPYPREWKGTIPKNIHHARLRMQVPEVVQAIDQIPKSLQHNVWDAVGLALWGLGKGDIN